MAARRNSTPFSTVLVTGATDGLGRATAQLLAREGYRIFAAGRNAEKRAQLESEARRANLPLEVLEMDVTDDRSVDRAWSAIQEKTGAVDVLVNSAGIAIVAPMEEISLSDLREQFETNYFGVVRVTQRALPGMRRRGRGRIINLSSVAGKFSSPLFGPYSSSKHALEAISDAMRVELAPFGIEVVLIEPGYIPSGMNQAASALSAAYVAKAESSPYAPLYRGFLNSWKNTISAPKHTPEDCARVILQAIRAARPRARYPVAQTARVVIPMLMKRFFPDRWLDRMMLKRLGLSRPTR